MKQTRQTLQDKFPASHAFLVGINRYDHIRPLFSAVRDVEAIAALLAEPIHGFQVHKPVLDGSFEQILELVETTMPELVQEDSRVLFYFAGHGIASESEAGEPHGYLLPRDVLRNNLQRAIPMKRLLKAFEQLPCRHFLLVLDCCFSGAFRWSDISTRGPVTAPRKVFKERFDRFVTDPAWQVITSAAYDQKAIDVIEEYALGKREASSNKHSPFAWHFMEGLKGAADIIPIDQPNGLITATELYLYLRDKVESQTIGLSEELRQTPSFFPLRKHDKGEYCFLSEKHPLNLPEYDPNRNPYKGLLAYEPTDRELFYGRERVSAQVLEQVAAQTLTVVSGASGTGKSSLVKAGILPVLEEKGYKIFSMRPGEHPLEALQKSLPDSIETERKKAVLFIDQMEEAITRCYEKQEREEFLQRLQQLLSKATPGLKVILTVRSDFEPQFEESALGEAWKRSRYIIPPFRHEELREVIEQPALQHVLYFDPPGLVDTIANEVLQAPGALPLLSYTLSWLFQEYVSQGMPDDRVLTLEYYEKLGGVNGSLRTQADRIFNNLDTAHKTTMRKVLLRMVSKEGGDLASRRVYMEELLYPDPEENQRVNDIIEQLYAARLIVRDKDADGQPFVEPAHDALIKAWSRLWEWIKAFEETLPLRDRLINSLHYYQNQGEQENLLLHEDPRLDQLEAIRKSEDCWLNKQEEIYVRKSVVLRDERKRKRRRNLSIVIIALAGLSVTSVVFGLSSQKNEALAKERADKLAVQQDSIIRVNEAILVSTYQNAINRAEARQNQEKFLEAVDFYNEAVDLAKEHSFLKDSLANAIAKKQHCEALHQAKETFKSLVGEAELLVKKYDEGKALTPALNLYYQALDLEVSNADKELLKAKIVNLEETRDSVYQAIFSLANQLAVMKQHCGAYDKFKLANEIKPGQKQTIERLNALEPLCKKPKNK